jgi:hypothetical protein
MQSADERLKELRRMHHSGLMDTAAYLEQQRKVLDAQHGGDWHSGSPWELR